MLDFRMETFLCVCRWMNFTRAAEELHITQPAVSQQIRFLEKHYKTKLFCYEGKRMMLTDAGQTLKKSAAAMLQDERKLQKQMLASKESLKQIRFGVTKTAAETVMPKLMQAFLTDYPELELHMEVAQSETILVELDRGELDFVLTEEYFPKGEYDFLPYMKLHFLAVCGEGYSLDGTDSAGKNECGKKQKDGTKTDVFDETALESLFEERLLLREADAGVRKTLESYLESQNHNLCEFIKIVETGDFPTTKELTKSGCGITFLYEASVSEELAQGCLKEIALKDFHVTHTLHFIWRKNSIYANVYREMFQQVV